MLSFFYTENVERNERCRAFLKDEMDKVDTGLNSREGYKPSSGETFFNEMFPNERDGNLTKFQKADCDAERKAKYHSIFE